MKKLTYIIIAIALAWYMGGCDDRSRKNLESIVDLSIRISSLERQIRALEKDFRNIDYSAIRSGSTIDITSRNIQEITPTLSVSDLSIKDQAGGIILSGIIINRSSTPLSNLRFYLKISDEEKDISIINTISPANSAKFSILIPNFKLNEENKFCKMYYENSIFRFN